MANPRTHVPGLSCHSFHIRNFRMPAATGAPLRAAEVQTTLRPTRNGTNGDGHTRYRIGSETCPAPNHHERQPFAKVPQAGTAPRRGTDANRRDGISSAADLRAPSVLPSSRKPPGIQTVPRSDPALRCRPRVPASPRPGATALSIGIAHPAPIRPHRSARSPLPVVPTTSPYVVHPRIRAANLAGSSPDSGGPGRFRAVPGKNASRQGPTRQVGPWRRN